MKETWQASSYLICRRCSSPIGKDSISDSSFACKGGFLIKQGGEFAFVPRHEIYLISVRFDTPTGKIEPFKAE